MSLTLTSVGQETRQPSHQRQELAVAGPRGARIGVRERIGGNVDVCDLTRRVHAGVGAAGRPGSAPVSRKTVDNASSITPATVRCPGLSGPAGEFGSVVGDVEPKTNMPATGVDGGHVQRFTTWRRRPPRRSQPSSALASSISASASAVWASAIASSSALTSSTDLLRNRAFRLFRLDRSLRRRCRRATGRGLLRRTCLARAVGLGSHRLLPHQLDDGHRGVVALDAPPP